MRGRSEWARHGDSGHEAVGQALLICGVSAGALAAASLADAVLPALQALSAALGGAVSG